MKKLFKYSLVLALTLGMGMAAYATPHQDNDKDKWPKDQDPPKHTAPEVDAGLAAGGLALVGGTIAVLRARRRK